MTTDTGPEKGVPGSEKSSDTTTIDAIISDALDPMFETDAPEAVEAAPEQPTKSSQPELEADEVHDAVSGPDGIPEKDPEPTNAAIRAPDSWDPQTKALFNRLPRPARRAWLRQVKEAQTGMSEQASKFADRGKFADEVENALKPLEQAFQRQGLTKPQAVQMMAKVYASIATRPVETIQWLVQQTNLKPEQIFPAAQAQTQTPEQGKWVDPAIQTLQQQFQTLQQRDTAREKLIQDYQTRQFISGVAQAKDETGALKYPHFAALEQDMAAILQGNPQLQAIPDIQQKFDTAYKLAVGQNHQKLVQAQLQAQQQQAVAQTKSRAASIRPALGSPPSNAPKKGATADEIVANALAPLFGR